MDKYLRHPSRPARWNGTDLAPVERHLATEVEVWAGWTEDGISFWEALDATPVAGEDTVRLLSVPAYVYGLNLGDTVKCTASAEGPLVVSDVRNRGGQVTFRIWIGAEPDSSTWRPIAESYAKRGCIVDVLTVSLIALSCAVETSYAIQAMLEQDALHTGITWESGKLTT